jgi:serine protease Do
MSLLKSLIQNSNRLVLAAVVTLTLLGAPLFLHGAIEMKEAQSFSIAKQLSKEFATVAKSATPAVVSIHTQYLSKQPKGGRQEWSDQMDQFPDEFWQRFFGVPTPNEQKGPSLGQGSGFVISADGYILTNNHVVQDADKITVVFSDGKELPGKVIGTDPNTDIALLKVEATNINFLVLGDSDHIEVGELVMAIGSPLRFQSTITVGVISAKGRAGLGVVPIESFIQTDAAINRGNSGGCLISLADGEVIGMNTAIASTNGGYIGIGFAIPSNIIKHIMEELRTTGRVVRGYVGVTLQAIDSPLAEAFNLDKNAGALVAEVVKESPAEKSGLKSGDIILKVDGKTVENPSTLRSTIAMVKPGDKIKLGIMRNKEMIEVTVTVATHPESEQGGGELQHKLGLLLQDLTPEIAQQLGYEKDAGVLIKYVDPNSNAQASGLRRGQLIISINQKPVSSAEEFFRILQETPKEQKRILLQIKLGQMIRYVSLELE